jgi:hypothetical protein
MHLVKLQEKFSKDYSNGVEWVLVRYVAVEQ